MNHLEAYIFMKKQQEGYPAYSSAASASAAAAADDAVNIANIATLTASINDVIVQGVEGEEIGLMGIM